MNLFSRLPSFRTFIAACLIIAIFATVCWIWRRATQQMQIVHLLEADGFHVQLDGDIPFAVSHDASELTARRHYRAGFWVHVWENPTCLRYDELKGRQVANATLESICQLKGFDSLSLWGENVHDKFVGAILGCVNSIQKIEIHSPNVTVAALHEMKNLPDLLKLDLSGCYNITNESIPQLSDMHKLEELVVAHTGLTEKGVGELRQKLPNCRIGFDP